MSFYILKKVLPVKPTFFKNNEANCFLKAVAVGN